VQRTPRVLAEGGCEQHGTYFFWAIFLAFLVFLASLAGQELSAVAGRMKTRETFTGHSRHPKKSFV